MLRQPCRLRHPREFARVRQYGTRWRTNLLTLTALENGLPYSRYGFVVSGRVGNAVTRNRVKRRLREIVRLAFDDLPAGFDFVVSARPKAARAAYGELETSFLWLIDHA